MDIILQDSFFNAAPNSFVANALSLYNKQRHECEIFGKWCEQTGASLHPGRLSDCRFLPISFFKTHKVSCKAAEKPAIVFTSSGTTGAQTSRHYVYNSAWYEAVFTRGWKHFFGDPAHTAFFCLLPSYMERSGSSLIYMMEKLVGMHQASRGGFYLQHSDQLALDIQTAKAAGDDIVLFGVSFALLNFAETAPVAIPGMVMDTGGMKGRKKEVTRQELHQLLCNAFKTPGIASEYGMTELMSQAYSRQNGRYYCPPWMKVMVRDESDPLQIRENGSGILCIIDLANQDSCAFIETQDVGKVFEDGSFEVLGRLDTADLRGCNLLVA